MKENDIVHVRAEGSPSVQGADVKTSLFGRQAEVRPAVAAGLPPGFRDERIAGGSDLPIQFQLNTPTTLAFLPDGRLLVTEKGGKLLMIFVLVQTIHSTLPMVILLLSMQRQCILPAHSRQIRQSVKSTG